MGFISVVESEAHFCVQRRRDVHGLAVGSMLLFPRGGQALFISWRVKVWPVHHGQGQVSVSKVLSEHMAQHPFAPARLPVGAPENPTQKHPEPQRQKQVGQDPVLLTVEYGVRGDEEGSQADHQEAK